MSISDFFTNTLGANLSNSRWSWGASNPQTNQLFLRVWEDQLVTVDNVERSLILETDRTYTSAGFPERKRHIHALRNGAEGYGIVCIAKDTHALTRTIADFDRQAVLKFGGVIDDGTRIYARVIGRVSVDELARRQTAVSSVVPDLKSILTRRGDTTEKETLANARVGQGRFRADVLQIWNSQCCVTGSRTLEAIRASHIKPWREATNEERLDPNNGLPLIATLDALFDAGLITFSHDGGLLTSHRLSAKERRVLGLDSDGLRLARNPNEKLAVYLTYHRDFVFVSK